MKQDEMKKITQFMKILLQNSPGCVPQPFQLIDEKAEKRLDTDDMISWKIITKEWNKVSAKGKKEMSKLLTLNSFDTVELLDVTGPLLEEAKDTMEFVEKHPEYGKPKEDMNLSDALSDLLSD